MRRGSKARTKPRFVRRMIFLPCSGTRCTEPRLAHGHHALRGTPVRTAGDFFCFRRVVGRTAVHPAAQAKPALWGEMHRDEKKNPGSSGVYFFWVFRGEVRRGEEEPRFFTDIWPRGGEISDRGDNPGSPGTWTWANRGCRLDLKSRPARGHVGEEPGLVVAAMRLASQTPANRGKPATKPRQPRAE